MTRLISNLKNPGATGHCSAQLRAGLGAESLERPHHPSEVEKTTENAQSLQKLSSVKEGESEETKESTHCFHHPERYSRDDSRAQVHRHHRALGSERLRYQYKSTMLARRDAGPPCRSFIVQSPKSLSGLHHHQSYLRLR